MEKTTTFNGACFPNDVLEIGIKDSNIFVAIHDADTGIINSIVLDEADTQELFNFVTDTKVEDGIPTIYFKGALFENDVLIVKGGNPSIYFEIIDADNGASNSIALTCEDTDKLKELLLGGTK